MEHRMKCSRIPRVCPAFTLSELLITIAIIGTLIVLGSMILIRSIQAWALRKAAVELAGYLENAQVVATGFSSIPCVLEITGSGDNLQIAPFVTAEDNGNACTNLPRKFLLPTVPIRLSVNPPTVTRFELQPGGTITNTITSVLTSANPGIAEYCVQVRAPSALIGVGVYRQKVCDYAAFN